MNKVNKKQRIKYPIVVEGKYDRQRILDLFDADCISTDGFGIFNSKETDATIRALARKTKIIVLTDSDNAGAMIRRRVIQCTDGDPDRIINLYTPQIKGKEKRKKLPSRQGYLGVEGMKPDVIQKLLSRFAEDAEDMPNVERVSKLDLYLDGLSGGERSTELRDALAEEFSLPRGMTSKALLAALSYVTDKDGYNEAVSKIIKGK